ncbi:MAG: anthranilate phosphoribosyltransferase [Synergistaceae bacterium]|jgi:anthranilate phosphoribosyltransferase|nr:anthranilate phosphoribosyltransferase [Synergistaceae bacterium]
MAETVLNKLMSGEKLTREESSSLFEAVIAGEMSDAEIAALLVALKLRGETAEEIAGAAQALREGARAFPKPDYPFADIVGTGGDGANTINISTAVTFVAAEAGLRVAKHGNRSVSSRCGAADLLERFGVRLDMPPARARKLLDDLRVTFLFAPHYHSGIRYAMPVRKALATRTMFNVLGPLINPARPPIMLVGVYDVSLCNLVAETLRLLGCERALVVNGLGLDEIATHGATNAAELLDGEILERRFTPAAFGVGEFPLSAIVGGNPEENEAAIRSVLAGRGSEAHAAAISVNASALLTLGGVTANYKDGFALARNVLESGKALERLEQFAKMSNEEEGKTTSERLERCVNA